MRNANIDPTTLDGLNINCEIREVFPATAFGTDWENGVEITAYVAYVNGQEIGAFETEDEAAEALMFHYKS